MPDLFADSRTASVLLKCAEYDVYTNRKLEAELNVLSGTNCVVDLANVRYLDSTCLGPFVRTLKHLRVSDSTASLTLRNVGAELRRLFDVTKLTDLFHIIAP